VLQKKRLVFGDKHMARVVAAASRAHGSGGMATSTGGAGTEVRPKPGQTLVDTSKLSEADPDPEVDPPKQRCAACLPGQCPYHRVHAAEVSIFEVKCAAVKCTTEMLRLKLWRFAVRNAVGSVSPSVSKRTQELDESVGGAESASGMPAEGDEDAGSTASRAASLRCCHVLLTAAHLRRCDRMAGSCVHASCIVQLRRVRVQRSKC